MERALVIDIGVKLSVVGLSVYPLFRPESAHFAGKAMGVRALLYPAVMLLRVVPAGDRLRSRGRSAADRTLGGLRPRPGLRGGRRYPLGDRGSTCIMRSGASGLDLTYENTIQDLGMSLAGAAVGALVVVTVLWPAPGTPVTLFGWS